MIRITGTIGQWPVDLNIELDDNDWARLRASVEHPPITTAIQDPAPAAAPASRPAPNDALWQNALALVRTSGQPGGGQALVGALAPL